MHQLSSTWEISVDSKLRKSFIKVYAVFFALSTNFQHFYCSFIFFVTEIDFR